MRTRIGLFLFLSISLFTYGDAPRSAVFNDAECVQKLWAELPRYFGPSSTSGGMYPDAETLKRLAADKAFGIIGSPVGGVVPISGKFPSRMTISIPGAAPKQAQSYDDFIIHLNALREAIYRESVRIRDRTLVDLEFQALVRSINVYKSLQEAILENAYRIVYHRVSTYAENRKLIEKSRQNFNLELSPEFARAWLSSGSLVESVDREAHGNMTALSEEALKAKEEKKNFLQEISLSGKEGGREALKIRSGFRRTKDGKSESIAEIYIPRKDEVEIEFFVLHQQLIQQVALEYQSTGGPLTKGLLTWAFEKMTGEGDPSGGFVEYLYRRYLKFVAIRRELVNLWAQRRLLPNRAQDKDIQFATINEFYSLELDGGSAGASSKSVNDLQVYQDLWKSDAYVDYESRLKSTKESLKNFLFFSEEDLREFISAFRRVEYNAGYFQAGSPFNESTPEQKKIAAETYKEFMEDFKQEMFDKKESACIADSRTRSRLDDAVLISVFPGDDVSLGSLAYSRQLLIRSYREQRTAFGCVAAAFVRKKIGQSLLDIGSILSEKDSEILRDRLLISSEFFIQEKIEKSRPMEKEVNGRAPLLRTALLSAPQPNTVAERRDDFIDRHERVSRLALPALEVKNEVERFLALHPKLDQEPSVSNTYSHQREKTKNDHHVWMAEGNGAFSLSSENPFERFIARIPKSLRSNYRQTTLMNADVFLNKARLVPRDSDEFRNLVTQKLSRVQSGLVFPQWICDPERESTCIPLQTENPIGNNSYLQVPSLTQDPLIQAAIDGFLTEIDLRYTTWKSQMISQKCNGRKGTHCELALLEQGTEKLNALIIPVAIETYEKFLKDVVKEDSALKPIPIPSGVAPGKQKTASTSPSQAPKIESKATPLQAPKLSAQGRKRVEALEETFSFLGFWQEFKLAYSKKGSEETSEKCEDISGAQPSVNQNLHDGRRICEFIRSPDLAENLSEVTWKQAEYFRFKQFLQVYSSLQPRHEGVPNWSVTDRYWILARLSNSVLDQQILADWQLQQAYLISPFLKFKNVSDKFNEHDDEHLPDLLTLLSKKFDYPKNNWASVEAARTLIGNSIGRAKVISSGRLERFIGAKIGEGFDEEEAGFKELFVTMKAIRVTMQALGENASKIDEMLRKSVRSNIELTVEEHIPNAFNVLMILGLGGMAMTRAGMMMAVDAFFERMAAQRLVALAGRSYVRMGLTRAAAAAKFGLRSPVTVRAALRADLGGQVRKVTFSGIYRMVCSGGMHWMNLAFMGAAAGAKVLNEGVIELPHVLEEFTSAKGLRLQLQNANAHLLEDEANIQFTVAKHDELVEKVLNGSLSAQNQAVKDAYKAQRMESWMFIAFSGLPFLRFKQVLGVQPAKEVIDRAAKVLPQKEATFMREIFAKAPGQLIRENGVVKGTLMALTTFGRGLAKALSHGNFNWSRKLTPEELRRALANLTTIVGKELETAGVTLPALQKIFREEATAYNQIGEYVAMEFRRKVKEYIKLYGKNGISELVEKEGVYADWEMIKRMDAEELKNSGKLWFPALEELFERINGDLVSSLQKGAKRISPFRLHIPEPLRQDISVSTEQSLMRYDLAILHAEMTELALNARTIGGLEKMASKATTLEAFMQSAGQTSNALGVTLKMLSYDAMKFGNANPIWQVGRLWKRLKTSIPGLEGVLNDLPQAEGVLYRDGKKAFGVQLYKEAPPPSQDIIDLDFMDFEIVH
jgi:hypothetical protein